MLWCACGSSTGGDISVPSTGFAHGAESRYGFSSLALNGTLTGQLFLFEEVLSSSRVRQLQTLYTPYLNTPIDSGPFTFGSRFDVSAGFEVQNPGSSYVQYTVNWLTEYLAIGRGTAIKSAVLRLTQHRLQPTPAVPIRVVIRVLAEPLGSDIANFYPWSLRQYGTNAARLLTSTGTQKTFLPNREISLAGDAEVDLTADVQAVVNHPMWSTNPLDGGFTAGSRALHLIAYTRYPQAIWVNNVHPTDAFPMWPVTNTAQWCSEPLSGVPDNLRLRVTR